MARPQKAGLDYFPLDVDMDDKIKLIDAKFGVAGFGVLIKLWQIIYSNGYYITWTEKELLLYKNRINADINLINDVINECLKWGIFNNDLYEKYSILTSNGIQKRYLEATKRRSEITLATEYFQAPVPENRKVVFVYINPKNVSNNPQSKVKESKVNIKDIYAQRFDQFWQAYPKKRSKGQAEKAWNKIKPDEQLHNVIITSLERAKTSADWQKEGGRYIPYPATWLNAKGWEDEYTQGENQTPSKTFSKPDERDWEKILGIE